MYGEEAIRASKLSQTLKNIIMKVIIRNRETRKVPKLKDILNEAINSFKKRQAAKRREEKENFSAQAMIIESMKPKMSGF